MNHSAARINYNRMSRWYDWFASRERKFTRIGLHMLNVQPGEKAMWGLPVDIITVRKHG
jgi:hypothetical protein